MSHTTDDQTARDYLDGWADPAKHPITVERYADAYGDLTFRAVCGCGWKGIPVAWRSQAEKECAVLQVLQEREQRSQQR